VDEKTTLNFHDTTFTISSQARQQHGHVSPRVKHNFLYLMHVLTCFLWS